jgi:hypothetical protein
MVFTAASLAYDLHQLSAATELLKALLNTVQVERVGRQLRKHTSSSRLYPR